MLTVRRAGLARSEAGGRRCTLRYSKDKQRNHRPAGQAQREHEFGSVTLVGTAAEHHPLQVRVGLAAPFQRHEPMSFFARTARGGALVLAFQANHHC